MPPDLGARAVGAQVVHIDAVLAEQGQHVLRGLHQLRGGAVFQRTAQRVEPGLVFRRFGEVKRAGEILSRERLCLVARLRAKRQRRLVFGGGRCGRGGWGDGARSLVAALKPGQSDLGLAGAGSEFIELARDVAVARRFVALLLRNIGIPDGINRGL